MARSKSKKGKKTSLKTAAATGGKTKADPLFPSRKRSFKPGQDVLPGGRDLGRYVKWPRYVRIQRQRKILKQRLKVPPAVNQFSSPCTQNEATEVFKLLASYRPETKKDKKERLKDAAVSKVSGGSAKTGKAPAVVKFGLNHVTTLIEEKKAKLVLIANDVDPIELVVWLPALCRKMDVPYMIIKNKARLGSLVHQKNATCLAVTKVDTADAAAFSKLTDLARAKFNDNEDALKTWGGGTMGLRTVAKLAKMAKVKAADAARKAAALM